MDIQRLWYSRNVVVWLLWPFSLLFGLLSAIRRRLFVLGVKKSRGVDAFVIVVGNITVGGNGKTPVVLSIVEHFKAKGIEVGVLSRGYGGSMATFPHVVDAGNSAALVGDEPSLIARRTGVPVVIDPVRARGAAHLADKLNCKVIVCDDGLQHYALRRDMELVVMDTRGVGNGHLLPMGPLREKSWRLSTVDGVILNGNVELNGIKSKHALPERFPLALQGREFYQVNGESKPEHAAAFQGRPVTAIAGIGHPQRFFQQLKAMGIAVDKQIPFPDHHTFTQDDIPEGIVIMTEKDAVKVHTFAHAQCWYLPVDAVLPPSFYQLLDTHYQYRFKE